MKKLFIFFCFHFILNNLYSQDHISFFHVTPETDNGYRTIKHTLQDSLGYIWMSQDKGVLKYDGYDFWFNSVDSIFKEANQKIKKTLLDPNGNLLVLSRKGLLSRKEISGNYTLINNLIKSDKKEFLIKNVFVKKNKIYIADFFNQLYLLDNSTLKLTHILSVTKPIYFGINILDLELSSDNVMYLSINNGGLLEYKNKKLKALIAPFYRSTNISHITLDKNENLWIATRSLGVYKYDKNSKEFSKLSYYRNNVDLLKKDMILSLLCDKDGIVWAGSDGEGLYKINPQNNKITLYRHSPLNKSSLSTNSILSINQDLYNNLWVVSNYGDINVLVNTPNKIFHHNGLKGNASARVLSVLKDTHDNIWIGTDGKGLTKKNIKTGEENQLLIVNNELEGAYIQAVEEDVDGNIWIGTYKKGMWFYDIKKDILTNVPVKNSKGKYATDILTIFSDSKGRMWVGSNLFLALYNNKKEMITSFAFWKRGLTGGIVRSILEDENNSIWIGVDGGGLFKLTEESNINNSQFHKVEYTDEKTEYPSVVSMVADTKGNLWIVDLNGKIYIVNTVNKSHKKFSNSQIITDVAFHSVLLENSESLWLGSNDGLWNLKTDDFSLVKYTKSDGFFSDYYAERSAYKDENGFLYFGGLNGVDGFNPKQIQKIETKPQLHINSIDILNKSASSIIPKQLKNGIENIELIQLQNNQSSFSFKFSVVGTVLNTNYSYQYRLLGFDDEWKYTKNNRIATYTNIPWGDYNFQVKASTINENIHIPLKSIQINVKPPLWLHPLAFAVYLILLGILIFGVYRWYLLRKKLFSQRIKGEEESKNYYEKLNFFSKMSHEIQTPLTLIMGPVEDIINKHELEKNTMLHQRLKVVFNNAKRLSRIANLLTTVRNKEIGQLNLRVFKKDIIKEINEISESFKEQARLKKIDFEIKNFSKSYVLWFDSELVEHMIYNLLSNAFKYTPSEGCITICTKINKEKEMFEISVIDTGFGISKKEYEDIFRLFYRSNKTKNNIGMGIGLAFVKELVHLHKGEISVKSKKNKGSTFTIQLPLHENLYSEDEKVEITTDTIIKTSPNVELLAFNDNNNNANKDSILIVEDNYEMLHFLCEVFSENYNVYSAYNGKEGIEVAKEKLPDLIISDITMPVMDGIEMCGIIQKDKSISHIPIIFLTAKNTTNYKIKGLKHGAIEFICKPFDINVLQLRVNSILEQNKKISSKANLQYLSSPEKTENKSKDALFLEKLITILNSKIEDPEFKLESLTSLMNLSYSNIYRNCQKVTGKTITELFRLLRLKRAAVLMVQSECNVSEACFSVGFNDTRYFSKCFKEQFKVTPTVFKNEAKQMDLDQFLAKYELSKINE